VGYNKFMENNNQASIIAVVIITAIIALLLHSSSLEGYKNKVSENISDCTDAYSNIISKANDNLLLYEGISYQELYEGVTLVKDDLSNDPTPLECIGILK